MCTFLLYTHDMYLRFFPEPTSDFFFLTRHMSFARLRYTHTYPRPRSREEAQSQFTTRGGRNQRRLWAFRPGKESSTFACTRVYVLDARLRDREGGKRKQFEAFPDRAKNAQFFRWTVTVVSPMKRAELLAGFLVVSFGLRSREVYPQLMFLPDNHVFDTSKLLVPFH